MYENPLTFENNGMFNNYLIVNKDWIEMFGLNEGIFLSILHSWLLNKAKTDSDFINGRYWVYNTYEGWLKTMPWIKRATFANMLSKLKELGIVICEDFNSSNLRSPKWYTINYEVLKEYTRVYIMQKHGAINNITVNLTINNDTPVNNVVQNLDYDVQKIDYEVQNLDYVVQNLDDSSPKNRLSSSKNWTANQPQTLDTPKTETSPIIHTINHPINNGVCVNATPDNTNTKEIDSKLLELLISNKVSSKIVTEIITKASTEQKQNLIKIIESDYFRKDVRNATAFIRKAFEENYNADRVCVKEKKNEVQETGKHTPSRNCTKKYRFERDPSIYIEMEELYKRALRNSIYSDNEVNDSNNNNDRQSHESTSLNSTNNNKNNTVEELESFDIDTDIDIDELLGEEN